MPECRGIGVTQGGVAESEGAPSAQPGFRKGAGGESCPEDRAPTVPVTTRSRILPTAEASEPGDGS